MRYSRFNALLVTALTFVALSAACGDDPSGSDTPDADFPDADSPDTIHDVQTDAGSPDVVADADDADAPSFDTGEPENCEPGATVTDSIGPAGGTITLCGASVVVEPDTLTEDLDWSITIADDFPEAPPGTVQVGAAFVFDGPDGEIGALYNVPHSNNGRPVSLFALADGEWVGLEACVVNDATIGQYFAGDHTLVASTADRDFPDNTAGLGSGRFTITFQETDTVIELTGSDYAIHDGVPGGNRSLDVFALQEITPEEARNLRMQLFSGPDGAGLISVQYGTTGAFGLWNWLQPIDGEPTAFEITGEGDSWQGSATVDLRQGETVEPATIAFEFTTEAFRFPPELACPGGGDRP